MWGKSLNLWKCYHKYTYVSTHYAYCTLLIQTAKSLTRLQLFQHPHYLLNESYEWYLQPGISGVEGALICTRADEFYLPEVSITGNTWSGFSGMPTKHIFPFVLSTLRYGSSGCWAETVSMMKSIDFAAAYAHDGKRNHQDSAIPFRGRLTKN